jgi:hypothetical protein
MITDERHKLVTGPQVAPMLFDLETDPDELNERGRDPAMSSVIERLETALNHWLQTPANRITVPDGWVTAMDEKFPHFDPLIEQGVLIGYWDEAELAGQHKAREAWLARQS